MNAPVVLPEPLWFSGVWSEWSDFVDDYYAAFTDDFLTPPKPTFQGRPVLVSRYIGPADEGKEAKFWHLITKEHKDGGRDPDPNRAERINWIRWLIENHQHFKTWKYLEVAAKTEYRWYIWAEADNFLVILGERDDGCYNLITSFWVETWNKAKLNKKYDKREP
jgi:hypothetical protein